jgi:hypothetical protein
MTVHLVEQLRIGSVLDQTAGGEEQAEARRVVQLDLILLLYLKTTNTNVLEY